MPHSTPTGRCTQPPGHGGECTYQLASLLAGTTELAAAGLDPEQEIRARALASAARALPNRDAYADLPDAALPAQLIRLADRLADWIRDGTRPATTTREDTGR